MGPSRAGFAIAIAKKRVPGRKRVGRVRGQARSSNHNAAAAAAAAAAADINIDLRGAVANDDIDTILALIGEAKADPDEKGTDGKSALDIANDLPAASANKNDIIDLLNEKAQENTELLQGLLRQVDNAIATIQGAAATAAAAAEANRIEALIRRLDLPNRFTRDIDDALARIAAEVGKVAVASPAAAAQYNDAATTDLGYAMEDIENNPGSPRNAVIDQGIIPRLQAGANPNATGGSSDWPFIVIAAFANNTRAVRAFVETANINVNAHEAMGQTALWHAARNGNVDMIRILAQNDELRLIPPDMPAAPNPRDVIKAGINAALRAEITDELDQIEARDGPAVAVAPIQQFVAPPQQVQNPVFAAPSPRGLRIAVPPNSNSNSSNSSSSNNSSPRGRRASQKLFGAKPPPISVAQIMANQARQRQERRAAYAAAAAPTLNSRRARGAPPLFPPPPPPPPPQGPPPPGFNNALRTIRGRPAALRAAAAPPSTVAVPPPVPPNLDIDEYNNPLDTIQTDGGYKHKLRRRKTRHKRRTQRKARRTQRSIK